ncbi:hypothetical protein Sulku_2443 [Sulfuricurvum kujiense DSM 16994]|uniref:FAD/FMN-containing dehydrogenase n=1 Tax=Sulfuricurvum kujiense (strain ATCC BAA-921 / DSM 16994 / JCM 11577 / YK-1) TaxID=709032 RepID=E4TYF7_SULKY|nr:hypothetical protein [Sulfuricurvum kujiense]ADR35102.1 hypothetical protein Sulku_2443 [Sulfuricurvum kujiense DSM 16994]
MKKSIVLLLVALSVWAAPYTIGQSVMPLDLNDQFGKKIALKTMPKTLVMAFEKETSATVNDCLGKQNGTYLSEHHAAYIADISPMPTFIAEAFALPKMRKYPYTVLLIRDEETGLKFPAQEGKITVLRFEKNTLKAIEYVATADELKAAIEQ